MPRDEREGQDEVFRRLGREKNKGIRAKKSERALENMHLKRKRYEHGET